MHKHYFIISFDRHNRVYGVDFMDLPDSEMRKILKEMKSFGVPFTHRIWFSDEKDIHKILKEQNCEYQNIAVVPNLNTLMSFFK